MNRFSFLNRFRHSSKNASQPDPSVEDIQVHSSESQVVEVEVDKSDPLVSYFLNGPGVVELDKLAMDSAMLSELKESSVKLVVPLVSQGELIGLINLGSRLSEQEYSTDDRRLLNNLATQAAPALRVAQLARQQQQEARERERMQQELRVARIIQETLLPKEIPSISGWELTPLWQPARAVSGDFYDFINFPDGRIGVICGDVTDKGVPAALVMATTRTILRSTAEGLGSPGEVLARANDLLCPDIPRNMFVTCLYMILDPETGELVFANAGHNLPYKCIQNGLEELCATGMPLGLMPGMDYEETRGRLEPGESLLLFSDGMVESHNPDGEMFGFPRLRSLMAGRLENEDLIAKLLKALEDFTGPGWEQEDDVTFVFIERCPVSEFESSNTNGSGKIWRSLGAFSLPSQAGNERLAIKEVAQVVEDLNLSPTRLERLKTAVAEATMNAMEHGNQYQEGLNADIEVRASDEQISIRISDQNTRGSIPDSTEPDLEAKLAGEQSPRGWGLFLIENMVDEMIVHNGSNQHTIELIFAREGE